MSAAAQTIREVATLESRAREAGKRIATFTLDTEIRFATAAAPAPAPRRASSKGRKS
jgi:hypothetical protein